MKKKLICFLYFLIIVLFESFGLGIPENVKLIQNSDTILYKKYKIGFDPSMSDSVFVLQNIISFKQAEGVMGVVEPFETTWYYYECYNPKRLNICIPVSTLFPEISIYQLDNKKIIYNEKIGFNSKLNDQTYKTLVGIFPITNIRDTTHLFLKIKGIRFSTGASGDIKFINDVINTSIYQRDKLVLISGIVLFAFCISILLWLRLRENYYLFFSLFSLSYIIYLHTFHGSIRLINPFSNYILGYEYFALPYVSMNIFIILYASSYIKLKRYKIFYRLIILLIIMRILLFAVSVYTQDVRMYYPMYDNLGLFICLLACIKNYKKDRTSLPVIVALALLLFTFLLHSLTYLDIEFRNTFLRFAEIENIVLAVFGVFGISLVLKLHQTRTQKENAMYQLLEFEKNTTALLEKKVEERTIKIREQSEILKNQADEITRMNELLAVDNKKLKVDIEEVTQAHLMHKNASYEDFLKYYPDTTACLKFLHELKLEKNILFKCSKCANSNGTLVVSKYSTRCTKCGYMEPVTYNTIYYNVKFPLNKAFYLTYLVNTNQVYTLDKISAILDLRKQTCLTFINKIKNIKQNSSSIQPGNEGWFNLIFSIK